MSASVSGGCNPGMSDPGFSRRGRRSTARGGQVVRKHARRDRGRLPDVREIGPDHAGEPLGPCGRRGRRCVNRRLAPAAGSRGRRCRPACSIFTHASKAESESTTTRRPMLRATRPQTPRIDGYSPTNRAKRDAGHVPWGVRLPLPPSAGAQKSGSRRPTWITVHGLGDARDFVRRQTPKVRVLVSHTTGVRSPRLEPVRRRSPAVGENGAHGGYGHEHEDTAGASVHRSRRGVAV